MDNGLQATPRSPLNVIFGYRLLTPAFAVSELARWAIKPIPVARYQPKPPRLICFFSCGEGVSPPSYQLTIHAGGEKSARRRARHLRRTRPPGADEPHDRGHEQVGRRLQLELLPDSLGRLPGDDEAGVPLAEDVAGGEVGV